MRKAAFLDAFEDHIAGIVDENIQPPVAFPAQRRITSIHCASSVTSSAIASPPISAATACASSTSRFGDDDRCAILPAQRLAIGKIIDIILAQPHRNACPQARPCPLPCPPSAAILKSRFMTAGLSAAQTAATVEKRRICVSPRLAQVRSRACPRLWPILA